MDNDSFLGVATDTASTCCIF